MKMKGEFSVIRKIIEINEKKCNGCGACAKACHEEAIGMVNGKAKLLKDDYCDGLGDCLPSCPTGAITFVEREAAPYDETAVLAKKKKIEKSEDREIKEIPSQLMQWPCQIKLTPVHAPYFQKADLLIAADCSAFAYANMHEKFMKDHITLVGCPKLDSVDYSEKLASIFAANDISSITITRMEVPCCGGLVMAVKKALIYAEKEIPSRIATISLDGKILKESVLE